MMKLRHWRKAKGLTAKETAKLFGISRIQLFRLENGTRGLTAEMAVKIESATQKELHRSSLRPDLWPSEVVAA